MRLTLYTDYALRVLLYLAVHDGKVCRTRDIAGAYGISENHLVKVVQHLAALGLIETVRGRRGGLRLARAPEEIDVAEVVRASEPDTALVECFDPETNSCPIPRACVLRGALAEAREAFFAALGAYTLRDLAGPAARLKRLLPRPVRAPR